jgi:hypothetical protein
MLKSLIALEEMKSLLKGCKALPNQAGGPLVRLEAVMRIFPMDKYVPAKRLAGVANCNLARINPASLKDAKALLRQGFADKLAPGDRPILDRWAEAWWAKRGEAPKRAPAATRRKPRQQYARSVMRFAGVCKGNLTRMKVSSEEEAVSTLRRVYGPKVRSEDIPQLDAFAREWWASKSSPSLPKAPKKVVVITLEDLKLARALENQVDTFFCEGYRRIEALAPILTTVTALGGLPRAIGVISSLRSLIGAHKEGPQTDPPDEPSPAV